MPRPKQEPEKYCAYCGKQMHRKQHPNSMEQLNIFRRRKYCNRLCMAKGQMREDAQRSAILKRIEHLRLNACEICGATANLANHHKDGDWRNNHPSNLMTLCGSCHTKWHWKHGKKLPKRQLACKICGEPARKLDMCQKHYQRFRKYGDPCLTKKKIGPRYVLVREIPGAESGPMSQE